MAGDILDGPDDERRRSEWSRLDEARRQAALDRARNERLHAERNRMDEARRRRVPPRAARARA